MPSLPAPTVTADQATRILAAYQAKYGTTTSAETAAAFKREVLEMVRTTVLDHEARKMMEEQNAARATAMEAVAAELPDPEGVA